MNKLVLAILFIATALPSICNAGGHATRICIQNRSGTTYYISGTDTNNEDWQDLHDDGAMNRPDHNWVDYKLDPGEVKCQPADINIGWGVWPTFQFLTRPPQGVTGVKTRIRRLCTGGFDGENECSEERWSLSSYQDFPINTPGRLVSRHKCLRDHLRDDYHDDCSLFYIEK